MDRFCGKCGARLDERTGLCPVCDPTADIINTVRSRAEEETVVPESDPVRQTAAPQPHRAVSREHTRSRNRYFFIGKTPFGKRVTP